MLSTLSPDRGISSGGDERDHASPGSASRRALCFSAVSFSHAGPFSVAKLLAQGVRVLTRVARLVTPLLAAAVMLHVCAVQVEAQDVTLERYERWKLHPAPGMPREPVKALLLLYVRNGTDRLIKRWRALLVVRDSMDTELFRLAIERDSADLAPSTRARVELTFDDRTSVGDDPYDHLLANDTTNLRVQFEEVRVVEAGEVAYLPAGVPLCHSEAAWARMVRTEGGADPDVDCQWTQEPLTVEFLRVHGASGAVIRPRLMTRVAWVFARDLQRP